MPEIPQAHQSIRPPLGVVLGLFAVLVVMAVTWFAVSAAVSYGGQQCPTNHQTQHQSESASCR